MTVLVRGDKSYFMGAQAFLLGDNDREMASDWASQHIDQNPAIKWVLGKFVEANNPNNNRQAWSLEDLAMKRPTINHAPMNMVHQPKNIVGAFVANELLYPTGDSTTTPDSAYAGTANPYIETLGAFWAYYFPAELKAIQAAHDQGSLFFSMECVSESITFEDPSTGQTQEFAYMGPNHTSYGDWNNNKEAIRWLNNPHFLAGALIVPPVRPGWSNAEVKSLSHYVEQHQEIAEALYDDVETQAPHLSGKQIEEITLGLLSGQIDKGWPELTENSNSSGHLSKNDPDTSSDDDTSDVSHQGGGDMDKTYTEEDLKTAIAKALEPVQAELEALKAQADADAVEARIAEMKAEHDAAVAALQSQLDEKAAEAQSAADERDNILAWLSSEAQAIAEAEEMAARKDERLAKIKEAANFSDEYIAANVDRWVAMNDESFEATVEAVKAAAEAAKADAGEAPKPDLAATSMKAERETASAGGSDPMANVRDIMRLSRQGFDPRTV
jgi:hypothetical protein